MINNANSKECIYNSLMMLNEIFNSRPARKIILDNKRKLEDELISVI